MYSLMSLFIAVIYNQFKGFFQDSMMSSVFRQSLAVRAAFWVLFEKFNPDTLIIQKKVKTKKLIFFFRRQAVISRTPVVFVIKSLSISKRRKEYLIKVFES